MEKYSREITDYYWDRLDGALPALSEFADVFEGEARSATDSKTYDRE